MQKHEGGRGKATQMRITGRTEKEREHTQASTHEPPLNLPLLIRLLSDLCAHPQLFLNRGVEGDGPHSKSGVNFLRAHHFWPGITDPVESYGLVPKAGCGPESSL